MRPAAQGATGAVSAITSIGAEVVGVFCNEGMAEE